MSYPYFRAKISDGNVVVSGDTERSFGNIASFSGNKEPPYGTWVWTGDELQAQVDPLGMFSLFYYAENGVIAVSPSLIKLLELGAPADFDLRSLAVFYMIGWQLEQDTPFKSIKVLPPNGKLAWKRGVLSVTGEKQIWQERSISRKDAMDGFVSHFSGAVKNQLKISRGPILLPLSGGRDSRHILFEMFRIGILPAECLTYGSESAVDPDIVTARHVARAVGVPHRVIDNRSSPIKDIIRAYLLTHFCSDEHWQYLGLRDYLGTIREGFSIFDGIGGDVLTRNKAFTNITVHDLCCRRKWGEAIDAGLFGIHPRVSRSTFRDRAFGGIESYQEEARDYLIENLSSFEGAADPWSAFLFWGRTRREISLIGTSVYGSRIDVKYPYISMDVVSHLMSIPFELTSSGSFHDEVISYEFPEFSSLPYAKKTTTDFRRRPIDRRIRTFVDGIRSLRAIRPNSPISNAALQLSPLLGSTQKNTLKWRMYTICLNAAKSAGGAKRLMGFIENLE